MRTVTANAQALLSQNMGTEMSVVLEVEWVDGGSVYYADQDIVGCANKIVSMGGFDTSMILEGSSDSQELSIVLDDVDGDIRAIADSNDIHKRPAQVYMLHKGLGLADKILVFKGEIVTPIEFDERQRTVYFHILSKLNATQVGFSMEEGDFPNIPDEALGKAWPLVFGQVCHMPTVKVRAPRRGYLVEGVGIRDYTLDSRICQALLLQCPAVQTGTHDYIKRVHGEWTKWRAPTMGPDLACVNRRFGEICRLRDLRDQQMTYEYDSFTVYGGSAFPQGEKVTLNVDGGIFVGTFSGNTFNVLWRKHPDDEGDATPCVEIEDLSMGVVPAPVQIGGSTDKIQGPGGGLIRPGGLYLGVGGGNFPQTFGLGTYLQQGGSGVLPTLDRDTAEDSWVSDDIGTHFTPNQTAIQAFQSCDEALTTAPGMVGGPKSSWEYFNSMNTSDFFWAPPGSEVFVDEESETLHIVSLITGTVDSVAAYRTAPDGNKYLTEVPTDYYTVYNTDYDGYDVVEIGMDKPLSHYDSQWEDDLYVSFTSSVGPNACDIIEWLVNKYTDLTVDSTSFSAVNALLTNYPKNFYLIDRPDVYELIQDIAYQSRCAVYVRNDVVYIRYLSSEPTSVRTLTASDILSGTFVEYLSETEDVYTTHNITWQKAGAPVRTDQDVERKLILKYNVKQYGTVEADWNYYTDNIYQYVLKTGTFWLIRKANSWRKVRFDLPIKHMDLDVGDCVTLDFDQFSDVSVKVIIESMNLNPDDYTVSVSCWTPIRAGETSEYYWAWPAAKAEEAIWPLADDNAGGGGYNFDVTPPIEHILTGGAHRDDQLIVTTGDLHPSDVGDTTVNVACELSDYLDFSAEDPEIILKDIVDSLTVQNIESGVNSSPASGEGVSAPGAIATGSLGEEPEGDCTNGPGCNYYVRLLWHTSTSQGQAISATGNCGGPCSCLGGCPTCTGPVWVVCYTYGAPWAARISAAYWEQQYGHPIMSHWECQQTGVIQINVYEGAHNGPFSSQCEGIGEWNPEEGLGIIQTAAPSGITGDEPE